MSVAWSVRTSRVNGTYGGSGSWPSPAACCRTWPRVPAIAVSAVYQTVTTTAVRTPRTTRSPSCPRQRSAAARSSFGEVSVWVLDTQAGDVVGATTVTATYGTTGSAAGPGHPGGVGAGRRADRDGRPGRPGLSSPSGAQAVPAPRTAPRPVRVPDGVRTARGPLTRSAPAPAVRRHSQRRPTQLAAAIAYGLNGAESGSFRPGRLGDAPPGSSWRSGWSSPATPPSPAYVGAASDLGGGSGIMG